MISGAPDRLRIYDPVANSTSDVALSGGTPLSLSIGPGGTYAAVLHATSISYINLQTRTVDRAYSVTYPAEWATQYRGQIVLAANWIHLPPLKSVRISDGTIQDFQPYQNLGGSGARLHPGGNSIYATRFGASPNDIMKYDVSSGPMTAVVDSPYHATHRICGPVWPSRDGSRVFDGCGIAFQAAGLEYQAQFQNTGVQEMVSLSETINGFIATAFHESSSLSGRIGLYTTLDLKLWGAFALKPFQQNSASFPMTGQWAFFNTNGTIIYAISRIDAAASGQTNNFFVQTIPIAETPTCFATFTTSSAGVVGAGGVGKVTVNTAPDCLFYAISQSHWIQVTQGGFGSGNTEVSYFVRPNTTGAARSGTITIGAQQFTINQPADSSQVMHRLSVPVKDAEFNRANNTIVLVSENPAQLQVYDPATRMTSLIVPLERRPTSVSVRPDGLYAAVGQEGFVSVIDLSDGAIAKLLPVAAPVGDVVLDAANNVHAFGSGIAGGVFSARSGTSAASVTDFSAQAGSGVALHPSGRFLYSPGKKWNIEAGAAVPVFGFNTTNPCGPWIVNEPGTQILTGCRELLRSSTNLGLDGQLIALLSGPTTMQHASHSSARQMFATIGRPDATFPASASSVFLHRDADQSMASSVALPPMVTETQSFGVVGKYVFWNRDGSRLWAISQADTTTAALFGVSEISPAECSYTLSPDSISAGYAGSQTTVTVTTQPGCPWTPAGFNNTWVVPKENAGGGAGSGSFGVEVLANRVSSVPRYSAVTVAGRSLRINQAGNDGWLSIANEIVTIPQAGAAGALEIRTSNPFYDWQIDGPLPPWLTVWSQNRGSINYLAEPNPPGQPTRTATVFVGDQTLTLRQLGTVAGPEIFPGASKPAARGVPHYLAVTAPGSWTATLDSPSWISFTSGSSGTGDGMIVLEIARNNSPFPRRAKITVGGSIHTLQQDGQPGLLYYPLPPCRIADTRGPLGQFGQPTPAAQSTRTFPVLFSNCGIPNTAVSYALNVTAVPREPLGYLTIYPTGMPRPTVSLLNSLDGRIKANATIVPAGWDGNVDVFVTNRTDVILDINGYFAPPRNDGQPFVRVDPCRALDTRLAEGGPSMGAGTTRTLTLTGKCGLPVDAKAYALNITVVPKTTLGYLTAWPTGAQRPTVSTLNALTGAITANAAIIQAGTNGAIDLYVDSASDVLVDVIGYFGMPSANALFYYPTPPCRITDTRSDGGGPLNTTRFFTPEQSGCNLPSNTMLSLIANATVVPRGPFGYLTLWGSGGTPAVSTLNALDGSLTSNLAFIPLAGTQFFAFGSNTADVLFDVSGFFSLPPQTSGLQ